MTNIEWTKKIINRFWGYVDKTDDRGLGKHKTVVTVRDQHSFNTAKVYPNNNENGALGKGERIILIAIAQHDEGVDRTQLTVDKLF